MSDLYDDDVFQLLGETSRHGPVRRNLPVRELRSCRMAWPERCQGDPGHGWTYPCSCWRRQTPTGFLRAGCGCHPSQKSPALRRGEPL